MSAETDPLLIQFGKRLKQLRQQAHLTQEELAFKSQLHRTYIGAIERGEKNISLKNLAKLASALKLSLPELLDFDHDMD